MPQVINTNIMSLNAQRNLNNSQGDMRVALQRLSSGLRINSAKDDAAGLAISERFTAQIRGYNQAVRNANDGISLAQTAEGAMQEMANNLQRIRELSVQAINATNSSSDRKSIHEEVAQMVTEINRVSATEFNGVQVLNQSASLEFQVGPDQGDKVAISIQSLMIDSGLAEVYSDYATNSVISGFTTEASQVSFFEELLVYTDIALDSVSSKRATFGALQNRFESIVRNGQNVAENLSASRSRIMDADFAAETAELTRTQILQQAGTAMLSQANQMPQNVLSLLGG